MPKPHAHTDSPASSTACLGPARPMVETLERRVFLDGSALIGEPSIAAIAESGPVIAASVGAGPLAVGSGYEVDTLAVEDDIERRFFLDGFHFATLIEDPQGRLILRTHPDQSDENGWGTSYFIAPFFAGGEGIGGTITSIAADSTGFNLALTGSVFRAGGTSFGTWTWTAQLTYDAAAQHVEGTGSLAVILSGTVADAGADLNLERLSSNYLAGVALQPKGVGNTGDIGQIDVQFSPAGDPRDFSFIPSVSEPATFPGDTSAFLRLGLAGTINRVDTLSMGESFQIAVADKPTFSLQFQSRDPDDRMSPGILWDTAKATDFAADNLGVNHLLLRGVSSNTQMTFDFTFASDPPGIVPTEMLVRSPADLVGGQKSATGNVRIKLLNTSAEKFSGPLELTLFTSSDQTLDGGDTQIAVKTGNIRFKPGQTKEVKVKVSFPVPLTDGLYHLLASATLGDAAPAIVAGSSPIQISQPRIDLAGVPIVDTVLLDRDKATSIAVPVRNDGNVTALGRLTVDLLLLPLGDTTAEPLVSLVSAKILKVAMNPGVTRQLKLRIQTPAEIDPGAYQLALRLAGSEFGVPNLTDGAIVTTILVDVV